MAHSRRVALVLDCGHFAQPAGRVDGTAPLVGSYTWCLACEAFHEVVGVGRHLHAVPMDSGSRSPAPKPPTGRSWSTGATAAAAGGEPPAPHRLPLTRRV